MTKPAFLSLIIASVVMMSWGCANTQPTHFYLLSPMAMVEDQANSEAERSRLSLGLGPIDLPAYLDRPQIVTRITRNALDVAEFDRWAEPLRNNIMRVLTENLSLLLGTDKIVRYPWKRRNSVDYQIVMDVIEFDANHVGDAVLLARWSVVSGDEKTVIMRKKSRYTRTPHGIDYQSLVEALSATLEELSREIADVIKPLSRSQERD